MKAVVRALVAVTGGVLAGLTAVMVLTRILVRHAFWGVRLGVFVLLGVMLLWGWLAWREVGRAQGPVVSLVEVSVTLPVGGETEIGRAALGHVAPDDARADEVVLALENAAGEGVVVRNAARGGRLRLDDGSGPISSDRWKIEDGAAARLPNGETLRFSTSESEGLGIAISGRDPDAARLYRARGDGTIVRFDQGSEQRIPRCAPRSGLGGLFDRLGGGTTSFLTILFSPLHAIFFAGPGDELAIASLGGTTDCDEKGRAHLALTGLPWRSLRLLKRGDDFFLAPDRAEKGVASGVRLDNAFRTAGGFADQAWPLKGVEEILIDRTRYSLQTRSEPDGAARIIFTPLEGLALIPATTEGRPFAAPACEALCPRWSRPYRVLEKLAVEGFAGRRDPGETVLRWIIGIVPFTVLFLASWRGARSGNATGRFRFVERIRSFPRVAQSWPLMLVLLSTMLALIDTAAFGLDPMATLALNWLLAGFVIVFLCPAGLLMGLFWLAITVMATLGALTLAGLAADGTSELWAGHLIKHKLLVLDLLPPFVTALGLSSPRALRPWLFGLVSGRDPVSRAARHGPMMVLLLMLLVWALFGSETGIAGFQPVEGGKFATALLCAGLVAALDGSERRQSAGRALLGHAGSLGLMVGFLVVLLATPVWQSDFSPALIIVLLAATIGGTYLALRLMTWLGGAFARFRERRRAPVAFMPVPWLPDTERRIATILVAVALLLPTVFWFGAGPTGRWAFLGAVGVETWPERSADQLRQLEDGFGTGLRVPSERVIAWIDLDFDRFRREGAAATAAYRDLEYQVIRSRAVISGAACGMSETFRSAGAMLPFGGASPAILRGSWEDWSRRYPGLCGPRRSRSSEAGAGRRNVLFEGAPIEIPVVQFDFAASYLMGRFGLGAATLFYAGQALCVLVALIGIVRLAFAGEGDRTDRTIRWFLAVLVAGSTGLFVLHWTISWSNVLGLLPVMGQPMTWLSAATSHHLFMAFPATLAILIGLRHGEADTRHVAFRVPPESPRRIFVR